MSTQGRRKNVSVIDQLTENPYAFQFFQAVRLLERAAHYNGSESHQVSKPIAGFVPPKKEVVRLHSLSSLSFPSSEIVRIQKNHGKNKNQWHMQVALMGLTGAMGVLPYHYTELILRRHKMKDESLSHFFDLFNHRTLSLFFQASTRYRLALEYERKKLNPPLIEERDTQTQALLSLIGLGTRNLTDRQFTRDESLVYYGGLLSQTVRPTTGLAQMLQRHFDIPVKIQEFIGQWQELIDDVRTTLPSISQPSGRNACLGRSAMLGRRGWFAQGKFRVILGPLNRQQFYSFAPGTNTLKALNELVRFYAGLEYDYDFMIRIRRADLPAKVSLNRKAPPIIGWDSWLSTSTTHTVNNDETLDISVAARRLR